MSDRHAMIETAILAAREAGEFLWDNLGKVKSVEKKKGDFRNLVSEIDKGSEAKVIAMIRERHPGTDILAEESGGLGKGSDVKWIIDPLDGTTNYLHGVPIFSVTIGIEVRGEMVAGVTYDPNHDELFTAEQGSGAFLNGRRLAVTGSETMAESLVVTGFPYDLDLHPDRPLDHFVDFAREAQGIRRLGSAALDLAYVAAGRFDAYWEVSLSPWDMAAGVVIVREAGGAVTDFSGSPVDVYGKRVLATNGRIHNHCLAILGKSPGR